MATSQFSAITKKPNLGLNYSALVKAQAAALPSLYAQRDQDEQIEQTYNLQNASLDVERQKALSEQNYYNNMVGLQAQEQAQAKSAQEQAKGMQAQSQIMGLANTGLGIYGTYKAAQGTKALTGLISQMNAPTALVGQADVAGLAAAESGAAFNSTGLGLQGIETVSGTTAATPALTSGLAAEELGAAATGAGAATATNTAAMAVTAGQADVAGLAAAESAAAATTVEGTAAAGSATLGQAFSTVAGPAAIGAVIGSFLGQPIGEAIGIGGQRERATGGAVAGGAVAGAIWGAQAGSVGGPVGAAVGAAVGLVVSFVSGGCIIITACTSRHSPEVEVARECRDKYMSIEHLRGYYWLAEKLVPLMEKYRPVKSLIKKILVDNIIEYGNFVLGYHKHCSFISEIVTRAFLVFCYRAGVRLESFTRNNGEVY